MMQKLEQDLAELSTAIQPTVSGINPVLLYPSLITCAIKRFRATVRLLVIVKFLKLLDQQKSDKQKQLVVLQQGMMKLQIILHS
ncbi:MAG: hypothetical protein EZS28_011132 [Streblomastix strix]|uniref:Uncharacterized protein n=1 Tax=Streblomastix strix TaxID=222440 RepID=A0A5J4WEJ4_9EUKA|nr:MAG: hypothetical protein EZS28_011132 [Streblomastix strix]